MMYEDNVFNKDEIDKRIRRQLFNDLIDRLYKDKKFKIIKDTTENEVVKYNLELYVFTEKELNNLIKFIKREVK